VAFGRCRKRRGGTPEGERVAFDARPHPDGAVSLKQMRLPAFCFLYLSFVARGERSEHRERRRSV
jgi:hypothetical protein